MYKAKIIEINKEFGINKVVVEFSDGKETFIESYQLTEAQGKDELMVEVVSVLNKLNNPIKAIKVGDEFEVGTLNTKPEKPVEQLEYERGVSQLQNMNSELKLGLISQSEYDVKLTEVKALKVKIK